MEKKEKKSAKQRFSAKRLACMAVFVALAYTVSFLEFPIFPVIFPALSFLELDFGNVFILLVAFLLGPVEGVIVCVLKELLRVLSSSTGGIGEIANAVATSAYILLPATIYRYKKGLKVVIPCLVAACFIGTGTALLCNRFITFPLLIGVEAGVALFLDGFWFIVAFNFIKTAAVSVLTILLYKRLSTVLKKLKI